MMWHNPLPGFSIIPTEDPMSWESMAPNETGLPMGDHPGAFGARRTHNIHEGVDLYCPEGTPVHAVEAGLVVGVMEFTGPDASPPMPWWLPTKALLVEGDTGVIVYGEIELWEDFWVGDLITAGDPVGRVKRVLVKDKGRPTSMLHLELRTHGTTDWEGWTDVRPTSLLDPTPHLLLPLSDVGRGLPTLGEP
jgi:murein DD-endopeptidase MepM/ murein hydrolase activator NlpD